MSYLNKQFHRAVLFTQLKAALMSKIMAHSQRQSLESAAHETFETI